MNPTEEFMHDFAFHLQADLTSSTCSCSCQILSSSAPRRGRRRRREGALSLQPLLLPLLQHVDLGVRHGHGPALRALHMSTSTVPHQWSRAALHRARRAPPKPSTSARRHRAARRAFKLLQIWSSTHPATPSEGRVMSAFPCLHRGLLV